MPSLCKCRIFRIVKLETTNEFVKVNTGTENRLNSFYPRGTGIMFLLRTSCAETRTPIPVPAPPPRRNWRLRFTNIKTLLFFTITLRFQIRFVLATIVYFITDIVHKHPCNLLSVVNMFLTRHRRRKLTKALWKSVDTHRKRVLYVCG